MALEFSNASDQKYKAEVTALAGTFSDPIIIPGWVERVSVVALPGGGGSALVQYTVDPESEIDETPGGVDWFDWDAGSVTVKAGYSTNSVITAVRIQAVTAAATLKIAGQRVQARK